MASRVLAIALQIGVAVGIAVSVPFVGKAVADAAVAVLSASISEDAMPRKIVPVLALAAMLLISAYGLACRAVSSLTIGV